MGNASRALCEKLKCVSDFFDLFVLPYFTFFAFFAFFAFLAFLAFSHRIHRHLRPQALQTVIRDADQNKVSGTAIRITGCPQTVPMA